MHEFSVFLFSSNHVKTIDHLCSLINLNLVSYFRIYPLNKKKYIFIMSICNLFINKKTVSAIAQTYFITDDGQVKITN